MERSEIATILARNIGSKGELGRRCRPPVQPSAVSMWLAGGPNANIDKHAEPYVRELLLKEEEAARLEAREANGPSAKALVEGIRSGDPAVAPIVEKLTKTSKSNTGE